MDHTVPDSWMSLNLGQVVDYGKTIKAEPSKIPDEAWILELEDIEKDTSKVLERHTFAERKSKSTKSRFKRGDVLYGKLRPYLNKVAYADADGFCTTEIIPISGNSALDARYLFHWMKHPAFLEYVNAVSHGLSMPRLGTDAGKKAPFVLAPKAEQKRIADKLDTLLSRVDACRERLDRFPTLIKRFKQSVLAAATSGKLTEDWRGGKDIEWSFERATDVCAKVQSGGTPKEGFIDSPGIPFLKVYNIVDQQVAFDYKPQFVSSASHARALSKSVTLPGDVLMNIVGPPLGKVAVVPFDHPEWNINQAITLFRPSDRISTGWLYCILCGGSNIAEIVNETRGSAGQTNISLSQCRDFEFPVPSVEEQTELVRRVGKLFTIADRLQAKLENASNQAERLTPSLLAKAFRGELVPQDHTDETAQKMLERLRATKSPESPKVSPRGKKRAATNQR